MSNHEADSDPVATPAIYEQFKSFDEFFGCDDVIERLKDFAYDYENPAELAENGVPLEHGILLYGPSGVGKTSLIEALVKELRADLIPLRTAELMSGNVGEPARKLTQYFKQASRSEHTTVLFFDELNSIFGENTGGNTGVVQALVGQAKLLFEEAESFPHIIIAGATNEISSIDEALLRPGRFDMKLEVKQPGRLARQKIFAHYLGRHPVHFLLEGDADDEPIDLAKLASMSEGLSGADIKGVVDETIRNKIRNARNLRAAAYSSEGAIDFTALELEIVKIGNIAIESSLLGYKAQPKTGEDPSQQM